MRYGFPKLVIGRFSNSFRQQLRQSAARVGLPHQALTDEESVEAGRSQARQILRGGNPALSYAYYVGRYVLYETERSIEGNLEGFQVAVVYADSIRTGLS
jgi:hypothetical protein